LGLEEDGIAVAALGAIDLGVWELWAPQDQHMLPDRQ
jgi:hypothetical protein